MEKELSQEEQLLLGMFEQDISFTTSLPFILQITITVIFSMMLLGFSIKKLMQLTKG